MSNRIKPWQKRKPHHKGERKRIVPLRHDDSRVSPLRVDDSRVVPLRVGDDYEEDSWDEGRIWAEMSKL